jgi:hypothetical protein
MGTDSFGLRFSSEVVKSAGQDVAENEYIAVTVRMSLLPGPIFILRSGIKAMPSILLTGFKEDSCYFTKIKDML